eukprot:1793462-Rhodomonas_salina.4
MQSKGEEGRATHPDVAGERTTGCCSGWQRQRGADRKTDIRRKRSTDPQQKTRPSKHERRTIFFGRSEHATQEVHDLTLGYRPKKRRRSGAGRDEGSGKREEAHRFVKEEEGGLRVVRAKISSRKSYYY